MQHFRFAVENLLLSAMIEAFFLGGCCSCDSVEPFVSFEVELQKRHVFLSLSSLQACNGFFGEPSACVKKTPVGT